MFSFVIVNVSAAGTEKKWRVGGKAWWRRGSNSRGITPIGNQEILKSDALDQLGHVTDAKYALHNTYTCKSCEFPVAHSTAVSSMLVYYTHLSPLRVRV